MPWYQTNYRANWAPVDPKEEICRPGTYGAQIWAKSLRNAREIAQKRGMGEVIVGERGSQARPYRYASEVLAATRGHNRGMYPKLHALCYLGMVAMACGAATIQEVLGDEGFVHDICHARSVQKRLIERVKFIEKRVPGYLRHK